MPEQTSLKKDGGTGPPGEDYPTVTGTGDGFAHKNATKGIPTKNTANEKQFTGSKGEMPGKTDGPGGFSSGGEGALNRLPKALPMTKSMETIHELAKSMGPAERAGMIKMLLKGADEEKHEEHEDDMKKYVTPSDLQKFGQDLMGEFRKALSQSNPGAELQKQGLVAAPSEAPKPGLTKMEGQPSYDPAMQQAQGGSELQKATGEGQWDNDGETLVPGTVPSFQDLAKTQMMRGW